MQMWIPGHVQLKTLSDVLLTIKTLPAGTLKSMLETLPTTADGTPKDMINPSTREAISRTVDAIMQCQGNRTMFVVLAVSVGIGFLGWGALHGSWWPTLGLACVIPVIWMGQWMNYCLWRHWKKQIQELVKKKEFEQKSFFKIVTQLKWGAVSDLQKIEWLRSLG